MTPLLFGLKGLDEYQHFFHTLRGLPYPIVHRFLVELREHELANGERDRWVQMHADQMGALRRATSAERLPVMWESYVRYRLLRRPIAFCMLTIYGENTTFLDDCLTIEGRDVFDRTPAAIFVGTHFGPQSALPFFLAALGREVTTVMAGKERDLILSLLAAYGQQAAARMNFIGVPDRGVLMKCLTKLRQGGSVAVFMEFSESDLPSKTRASFLNLDLPAPEGPFLLAAVTGRPIVPVRVLHTDDLRMRLIFDEPVEVPKLRRRDLSQVIQPMWDRLQEQVLAHPDQWLGWEVLAAGPCANGHLEGAAAAERA
jgi:lauroyl/myristoyl acyltransferase